MYQISRIHHIKKRVAFGLAMLLTLQLFGTFESRMANQVHAEERATLPQNLKPLTKEDAKAISEGKIRLKGGKVESSLVGREPLDPDADDDEDGLKNSEEVFTYEENGNTYLYYKSHPYLKDTDGDGITDDKDSNPLGWNMTGRDAIMMMELCYRNDDYINRVLDPKPLREQELYKGSGETEGRKEYAMMNRELGPYWSVDKTWHLDDDFDAVLFKYTNKSLPFLDSDSTYVLAIRGTAGSADVTNDVKLGAGSWPWQATSAQNVADELSARSDIKNLYVTGHSLGGYLAQIFMVRYAGADYADPKKGFTTDNLMRHDPDKKSNQTLKRVYTFQSPRVPASILAPYTMEYAKVADIINTETTLTYHYRTNNDSVSNTTGAPDNAITLPNSERGHSSRSFFESQFDPVADFSIGTRQGLSAEGYQDPILAGIRYYDSTTLKFTDKNSKVLNEKVLAQSEESLKKYHVEPLVPEHYELVNKDQATMDLPYGQETEIQVQGKEITLTYRFKAVHEDGTELSEDEWTEEDRKALAEDVKVKARYAEKYELPAVPSAKSEDYRFKLKDEDGYKVVPGEDLTEDKTINVLLVKEDLFVESTVTLRDAESQEILKTLTIQTKPSQKDKLTFDKKDLPENYKLVDGQEDKLSFDPGSQVDLNIERVTHQVTIRLRKGDETLGTVEQQIKHGDSANLDIEIPYGYELVNPNALETLKQDPALQSVTEDVSKDIELKVKEAKQPVTHKVTIRLLNGEEVLSTSEQTVEHEGTTKFDITIPDGYELVNPDALENLKEDLELQSVTDNVTRDILLKVKDTEEPDPITPPVKPINPPVEPLEPIKPVDPVSPVEPSQPDAPIIHKVAINLLVGEDVIDTYEEDVEHEEAANLDITIPDGYELVNPGELDALKQDPALQSVTDDVSKDIQLKVKEAEPPVTHKVTIRLLNGEEVLSTREQTVEHEGTASLDITIPDGYELVNPYDLEQLKEDPELQSVTDDVTRDILLKVKDTDEPDPITPPVKPINPPVEPVEPVEPVKPVDPVSPVEPPQPDEPKDTETSVTESKIEETSTETKLTETKPSDSTKPLEPKPTDSTQSISASTESSQNTSEMGQSLEASDQTAASSTQQLPITGEDNRVFALLAILSVGFGLLLIRRRLQENSTEKNQ